MAKKLVKDLNLNDYVEMDGITGMDGLCISNDLSVIDGNYYQTTSGSLSNVFNFSGKNSFIQAEEAKSGSGVSYGPACTGSRGFVIIGIKPDNRELVLSGDVSKCLSQSELASTVFSYSFADSANTLCLKPVSMSVDGDGQRTHIIFKSFPLGLDTYKSYTEEQCIDRYENDDNGLYIPARPDIGNVILKNFFGNHVEGGSSKAIGKYTHAEGRSTIADVRYSHAEGSFTTAGGIGSHAEGMGWPGYHNVAFGGASHVEGGQQGTELGTKNGNKAIGNACHAEGGGDNFAGSMCYNVLGVYGISAMFDSSPSRRQPDLIETPNTIKLDSVDGIKDIVKNKPYYSIRLAGNFDYIGRILAVDENNNTISVDGLPYTSNANGNPKFCGNRYDQLWIPDYPELGTYALGYGAHTEGYASRALQNGAHAEGCGTVAGGKYSHAEGLETTAGYCAHAEGVQTQALGMYSHAAGRRAITGEPLSDGRIKRHDYSYAWSGVYNKTYYSHGDGTYNINPEAGINGFYVGDTRIGLGGQEFDLASGEGVLNALSVLIEKFGGKVKPVDGEDL